MPDMSARRRSRYHKFLRPTQASALLLRTIADAPESRRASEMEYPKN